MKKFITILLSFILIMAITLPAAAFKAVPVKGIKLDKSNITLKAGQTYNLKVTLTPANTTQKSLTVVTSNKKVATVSVKGMVCTVKGIGKGTAAITVYTYNKKINARCNVTVSQPVIATPKPKEDVTSFPIVKDKQTFKAMGAKNVSHGPWEDMTVFKKMEELTNIHFEWDTPLTDVYAEKKNLVLVSGAVPDVFIGNATLISAADEEKYGVQQKVFIPLEGYIEKYAPHLSKLMKDDPSIRFSITASDGHIYSLPYIVRTKTAAGNIIYINMKWLENVGKTKPENVDQMYEVLKAFKEKDPNKNGKADEIPMATYNNPNEFLPVLGPVFLAAFSGQAGGVNSSNSEGFDIRDGKVVYNPGMPYFKDFLQYMHKLYKEELVDSEMFTQTYQNMVAKGKDGRLGTSTVSLSAILDATKYDPKTKEYELIPPLTSAKNNKKVTQELTGVSSGAMLITNKCKNPAALIRWADVFYRTADEKVEGICGLTHWLGIYGSEWEFANKEKTTFNQYSKDPKLTTVEYVNKCVTPGNNSALPALVMSDAAAANNTLLLIKRDESLKHYFPYMVPVFPSTTIRYTQDEVDKLAVPATDLRTYVAQMTAKFITGEESLEKFDDYISNLKNKMHLDEVLKIKQDAYKRWSRAQ